MDEVNSSASGTETVKLHFKLRDTPLGRLLMPFLLFFAVCFIAELADWYLTRLSVIYSYEMFAFSNNQPVIRAFDVNFIAVAYTGQMVLSLTLFIIFYLFENLTLPVKPRLILIVSTLTGSFTGNFAGYLIFFSNLYYLPFLSHGNLTLTMADTQPSILGELLYASLAGDWLRMALVALGGFFMGGLQLLTEESEINVPSKARR